MGFKITYTDKSGKVASITFGSRILAESYSRTVKNATIQETATDAPSIEPLRCPEGPEKAQREATERYYLGDRADLPTGNQEESEAEAMAEHFAEARCVGQCMEDAWADWDYSRGVTNHPKRVGKRFSQATIRDNRVDGKGR